MKIKSIFAGVFLMLLMAQSVSAQKNYQSLLWQISGKGLKKPSYLYGTMHVSNKIAFNLGDSFFLALKSVDQVALEFNPSVVVEEMISSDYMAGLLKDYANHIYSNRNRTIQKNMFYLPEPDNIRNRLQYDISGNPDIINFLLYRYKRAKEDFEEDTYLDLYIYQSARKLNKKVGAVEDFAESLRLVLEAEEEMAEDNEKQDRSRKLNSIDVGEEIDNAYRRGDLDAIDSIYNIAYTSKRYLEKMLYIRNANMAKCMDSIMQQEGLFTAVGAAHLPGKRGVIHLLREMGYTVQPVNMGKRSSKLKNGIDATEVPFSTKAYTSYDKMIQTNAPSDMLYWNTDPIEMNYFYSDQANGSYYTICRVKTYSAFRGFSENYMLQSIDSFLYEFVPGDILSKNDINVNGYKGYDILSRNRRGNTQRYLMAVTPFELILFKASGTGEYTKKSGGFFFKNIVLSKAENNSYQWYKNAGSGFEMLLPGQVITNFEPVNPNNFSLVNPRTFQAQDIENKINFVISRFTVNNPDYIDEDTFELSILEKSVIKEMRYTPYNRLVITHQKRHAILSTYRAHDSTWVRAMYVLRGAHAYVVLARADEKNKLPVIDSAFRSFRLVAYPDSKFTSFSDTSMRYKVSAPEVALGSKDVFNREQKQNKNSHVYKGRRFYFVNNETDEQITLDVDRFHRYGYAITPDTFWYNRLTFDLNPGGFCIVKDKKFSKKGDIQTMQVLLADTNTSRLIHKTMHLRGRYLYTMAQVYDAEDGESNFWKTFNNSFTITDTGSTRSPFDPLVETYINDLNSKDSTIKAEAEASVDYVSLKKAKSYVLIKGINQLRGENKKYIALKSLLLKSLGYCTDTAAAMAYLKKAYLQVSDTSTLQVAILEALAEMNTKASFTLLAELIRLETPILYSAYELNPLFNSLGSKNKLKNTATLYPALLQLCTFEDYKSRVYGLLAKLVDSNTVKPALYAGYITQILNDARVEMKKKVNNKSDYSGSSGNSNLYEFNTLLVPFAAQTPVRNYFDKLLLAKDVELKLRTAATLLVNKQYVPDSIWENNAASYKNRIKLYKALNKVHRLDKFPAKYATPSQLTLSWAYDLAEGTSYRKLDTVIFVQTIPVTVKGYQGLVYVYKYKNEKEQDMNMLFCGIQPLDTNRFELNDQLNLKTNELIEEGKHMQESIMNELDDLIINSRIKNYPRDYTGNNY